MIGTVPDAFASLVFKNNCPICFEKLRINNRDSRDESFCCIKYVPCYQYFSPDLIGFDIGKYLIEIEYDRTRIFMSESASVAIGSVAYKHLLTLDYMLEFSIDELKDLSNRIDKLLIFK